MIRLSGKGTLQARFVLSAHRVDDLPNDGRPQVAFCGRSNVGKSSLLNRLVGHKGLAKVSQTPGKTRALNVFEIAGGLYFVDLPGFGYAKVSKSTRRSWGKLFDAYFYGDRTPDAVIALFDARRDPNKDDVEWVKSVHDSGLKVGVVLTKADKLKRNERAATERASKSTFPAAPIWFSSVTGEGKRELLSWIDKSLGA